jgi:hypothetical protein
MSAAIVMPIAHQNAPWKALVAPWARRDLEGDRDDRGAERCADLLGDAGVHGGVRDACRLDVLVGDGHRRDQHRPDPQTADQ